ncbi:MAG: pectate lyase [Duncaniella sp.]|nr:pectate lyase [Duncaniella sp.]
MKKALLSITSLLAATALSAQAPAFPGAEGFGRYTTGGRGGNVIHVTNLNDSGPGSLREAVKGSSRKIVVFDVSGYIDLQSDLQIDANTTIAGQTAPGQGITVRYYTVQPHGDNIIIRFLRFRRSQVKDVNDGADAIWGRNYKNIIIDHCSMSWSIDEVASFYDNRDFTMQWCTITEALANPGHSKGAHSYGGIWGGKGASFHHNFIAHVQNRAPRFNGARYSWTGYNQTKYKSTVDAERVDFRNCLMYNWGDGGCYGGPGGGYINMVNNYYKAGPGTKNTTRVTQVTVNSASNGDTKHPELYGLTSRYYISGNYVSASGKPENYDWNGVVYDSGLLQLEGERYMKDNDKHYKLPDEEYLIHNGTYYLRLRLDEPSETGEVTTHAPIDVLEKVTTYAGASLYRDAVDVRNMDEALKGTTTYTGAIVGRAGILDVINDPDKTPDPTTASFPTIVPETRPADWDTDGDGMPDKWEIANNLDPNNPADGKQFTLDPKYYYSNVEVYLNSIVEQIMKDGNAGAIDAVDEYYPACASAALVDITAPTSDVDRIEYYDLNGILLAEPPVGISIRRTVFTNGTVAVDKVIKR